MAGSLARMRMACNESGMGIDGESEIEAAGSRRIRSRIDLLTRGSCTSSLRLMDTHAAPARGWLHLAWWGNGASRAGRERISLTEMPVWARAEPDALLAEFKSSPTGLSAEDARQRLADIGPNQIARERALTIPQELLGRLKNPLNFLLLALAAVSLATGDSRAATLISLMVVLSVGLAFFQEHRSNRAAARLRAMVHTSATVRRQDASSPGTVEEPMDRLVPGDIVLLAAGDLVPADLRLLSAKDLHINQSALTGEAMPVEKSDRPPAADHIDPLDLPNVCYLGSSVLSGTAVAIVLQTGARTYFGRLADAIVGTRVPTAFDRGVTNFTWLMLKFIVVMVPAVFLINGLTKGNWLEALLFAVAVAVGLTPEMLPTIVTVNLAKGATAMARKRVIVKRLNAIQNLGAMDVLCTDKTGTLTQDRIILQYHLGLDGEESERVLHFAWLNSQFQSGLKNLLDVAVLKHGEKTEHASTLNDLKAQFTKVDEIPFDFQRRRMSVVLSDQTASHLLITKGAVEEVLAACEQFEEVGGRIASLDAPRRQAAQLEVDKLNEEGFRVVGVAYRRLEPMRPSYSVADEVGLTLLGYIAFLDPPKESAIKALALLRNAGVTVKILTGDALLVTRTICRQVNLPVERFIPGSEVEGISDADLTQAAEGSVAFVKLSPEQKARVIEALHRGGHVVGFLGDGINDGPALKAADVGVSVDTAVDIAKESADIILLEKSLIVLSEGVTEGRKVFGNIVKYIKMGASSNFGNMFSVLGASIFLPFLPMMPIQVLTNNLLYDFSQTTIPTDHVDADYLALPRKWDLGNLTRFVLFIGPISSVFDYVTYAVMLLVFKCWNNPSLFQAGWFVESLMTQTLIIHIIRTARLPFIESRASTALIGTTALIVAIGSIIPYTPLGATLGFKPLPMLYWPILAGMMISYAALTHIVKTWFVRRYGM
jgi:P-type Mg2+ transporter